MLNCIIGQRWNNLGAQFPGSVGTTLQRFLGFLIFWAIELPFCSQRPYKLRWLYTFKAWTLPPSVMGLLIYCLLQSKGQLASDTALAGVASPKGAALAWLMVSSINSVMGQWVCCHLFEANLFTDSCDDRYSLRSLQTCLISLATPPARKQPCGHISCLYRSRLLWYVHHKRCNQERLRTQT